MSINHSASLIWSRTIPCISGLAGSPRFRQTLRASWPPQGYMLNNLTAAYDPIFWVHHSNIDRIWAQWQTLHPGVVPSRPYRRVPWGKFHVADFLSIRKLGYEYASDTYMFPTNPTLNIKKFVSGTAGVLPGVMATHRRAEVRLDSVHQPREFFIVRVFLNLPNADVSTSIDNNPHYAGHFALFGHGTCIGGPGHCDPRPRPRRAFDTRSPNHNDPWNIRMDVTSTVRQLISSGEKARCSRDGAGR
jgi:tyrosinase